MPIENLVGSSNTASWTYSGTVTTSSVGTSTYSLQQMPKKAKVATPSRVSPFIREYLVQQQSYRERLAAAKDALRQKLAEQSQNRKEYSRGCTTVEQFKLAKKVRELFGPLAGVLEQLHLGPSAVRVPEALLGYIPAGSINQIARGAFVVNMLAAGESLGVGASVRNVAQERLRKLNLYSCPLTGVPLFSLLRSYGASYTGPESSLVAAGAVSDRAGRWYRSAAERAEALQLREVLTLVNGDLMITEVPKVQVERGVLRKTADGRDVLLPANYRAIAEYHSGVEDVSYDSADRHVGIELEVNAGPHNSEARNSIAAEILLATNRRVKVERDGSVTGFELISGHGKPSSVRQELAAVFRQKLLTGFRTARSTGAHVHVTALSGDADRVIRSRGYYQSLLPIYAALAGRPHNRYCRDGMGYGRYSSVNPETGKGTVEFRLFKAQLKLPKLIRNAQFAWAYMELLGQFVDGTEATATLDKFLEGLADLPREETLELRAWLAGRGYKVPHNATELRRTYRSLGVSAAMA